MWGFQGQTAGRVEPVPQTLSRKTPALIAAVLVPPTPIRQHRMPMSTSASATLDFTHKFPLKTPLARKCQFSLASTRIGSLNVLIACCLVV